MTEHGRAEEDASWARALSDLEAWHESGDRMAAQRALVHIEAFLRLRVPPVARRRWSSEQLDDVLQGFLERLLNKPLPPPIEKPAPYLSRAFKRWCIDRERGRKADRYEPWDEATPVQTTHQAPAASERLDRVAAALETLRMEDRVVLKMVDVPHALTWEELDWLGRRLRFSAEEVRDRLLSFPDKLGLTLVFDPGTPPQDPKERRDRLERFRRRRSRARTRLRQALGEDE